MTKSKLFVSIMLIAGSTTTAFAQSTASAIATANVITPISIAKNADMAFGNLAVQAATGGTVVLAPAGTRSRTGGVSLPATTGSVTAASFTVTGNGNYGYSITLPTTLTLTHSGGIESMVADNFTSTPSGNGTLSSGTQNISVGATLNVNSGQLAGAYTSGNFDVTVNYN